MAEQLKLKKDSLVIVVNGKPVPTDCYSISDQGLLEFDLSLLADNGFSVDTGEGTLHLHPDYQETWIGEP